MSAQPVARPGTDEAARLSRETVLAAIDKQFTETFDAIRARRDAAHEQALEQSLARTRRALEGVHVMETGRLLGDPHSVSVAVSVLSTEAGRFQAELTQIQETAEREWASARADRDERRQPFAFGGARVRLHVLSPTTAKEA